jgi:hypothetical protein
MSIVKTFMRIACERQIKIVMRHATFISMRGLAILLVAIVVLSAMVQGQPHFSPRPTGPMPAVNVP